MKTFKRLLAYAKPYSKYVPSYLILSIFSVLFGILNYGLVGPLLNVLFSSDSISTNLVKPEFVLSVDYLKGIFSYYLSEIMATSGPLHGLIFVCLLLIIASLLANVTYYLSRTVLISMRTNIMKGIRKDLFDKISILDIGYFHNRRKGDILSSISNDVNEVQNSVADSFQVVFREPLLIIGFLAALFYMSPQLTIVTIVTLPVSAFAIGSLSKKLRSDASIRQSLMGRIISHFEEGISGARIIKAFNGQKYVRASFNKTNERHRRVSKNLLKRNALATPLSEFLGITVASLVLFYGGWLNINGKLDLTWSEFVVYIAFYWRVLEPSKAIAKAWANIQKGLVSGDRIFAILDVPEKIEELKNPVKISEFKTNIKFKDVCFQYSDDPVLKNINFEVKKGETIAIVGPSGGGKSTIADLLPRFYDVNSGSIMIDGIDIRKYNKQNLISLMGIVNQDAILFNDNVYNNIKFGMEGVTEEDIINAAKIANAHDFILQMSDGYNTNIGDAGLNLSGGQRQRLAIARAVLKNPPILILDEATSALDTESEQLVQNALNNLMKNRTSIVIAHRLSTIQNADNIIVLEAGKIVERGTHEELLNEKGLYSHLCNLQSFK
ncbi:MAG: ABC transporter transmembrane domain-containing protein [Bacteroidales bacterium]